MPIKKINASILLTQTRFSDASWYEYIRFKKNSKEPINCTIIGLGSLGSWLSLSLARENCDLTLYDGDTVNEVNIASQNYILSSVGKNKVEATINVLEQYADLSEISIDPFKKNWETGYYITPIVFSCADSMSVRKNLFNDWKLITDKNKVFIDGRSMAELGYVYCVQNKEEDIKNYENTLFDDIDAFPESCSYKHTTFNSLIVSSLMCSVFNNWLTNISEENYVREIPFEINYQLNSLTFNT